MGIAPYALLLADSYL